MLLNSHNQGEGGEISSEVTPHQQVDEMKQKEKEYLATVRFGVSEIDANFELKRFLFQQSQRKINIKNRLEYDIKNFMEDLVKIKQGGTSKAADMAAALQAKKSKKKISLTNKFARAIKVVSNSLGINSEQGTKRTDIEQLRL